MSKLQDWTRARNLDRGHIGSALNQLDCCSTLTFREKEIVNLCIDYLNGITMRWHTCTPTSKREYLEDAA